MNQQIRILIADDHKLIREGLRALLAATPEFELVGDAVDGNDAVQKARSLEPDVILLDLVMPHKGGIEAIAEIKQDNPNAHILVLTSFGEDDNVYRAIKAGALGFLLKDSSPSDLKQAIKDVYQSKLTLHPNIAHKLIAELNRESELPPTPEPLTERELEILKMVAQGMTNEEIGAALIISDRTVGTHISNILGKLYLANRTQAALYALRKGIADLDAD